MIITIPTKKLDLIVVIGTYSVVGQNKLKWEFCFRIRPQFFQPNSGLVCGLVYENCSLVWNIS